MNRVVLAIGTCALLLGCGGGADSEAGADDPAAATTTIASSSSSAAGEESTGVEGDEVTDARVVAQFYANTVVAWGEQAFDLEALAEGTSEVYPDLTLSGSAIAADPSTVSAVATLIDDKSVASADNPHVVAFAVKDTGGRCVGVAVTGHPAPTEILHFEGESGDQCTAGEMADAVRDQAA